MTSFMSARSLCARVAARLALLQTSLRQSSACAAEFAEHVQLDVEIRLSLHELSVECMQGVNILSRTSLTRPWNCLLERG